MAVVMISSRIHSHPSIIRMPARAVAAWTFSICWLSSNKRADTFPRVMAPEFGATPKVTEALFGEGFWVDLAEDVGVPQWVTNAWGNSMQLWKFGPLATSRPKIPDAVRQFVYERDGWVCLFCGSTENLTLDHIHPWSLGGRMEPDNLQTLCRSCNSRKGAKVDAT